MKNAGDVPRPILKSALWEDITKVGPQENEQKIVFVLQSAITKWTKKILAFLNVYELSHFVPPSRHTGGALI